MVKFFVAFTLLCSAVFADNPIDTDVSSQHELLHQKILSLVDQDLFVTNKDFINVIFEPESAYFRANRVDVVKVVQNLKDNGLLKLFFAKPQTITLHFQTNGSPLFFVKLMENTLRNIGYYRYVTVGANRDASEFRWSIELKSEYATDPIILDEELHKSGCNIVDIKRKSATEWSYTIDISNGYLHLPVLEDSEALRLKRSLYAHWLNVSQIKKLSIKSSFRNTWYPYIAYYDASMHLLKVIKENEKYSHINLNIPKGAKYIKISDLYTLKNLKDELVLMPSGRR